MVLYIGIFVILGSLLLIAVTFRVLGSRGLRIMSDGVGIALLGTAILAGAVIPPGPVQHWTMITLTLGAVYMFALPIIVRLRRDKK